MTCGSFGAAGMLCPGLANSQPVPPKPAIIDGLIHRETCLPAWVVYPCDGAGGYDYSSPTVYTIDPETGEATETTMSATFSPGAQPDAEIDKEDLTPLSVVGPQDAASVSLLFDEALAASSVTAFSEEGSDITEADVAECGTFSIATKDGRPGIVLNGDTANPVASWSDPDGVNMANTFEVLDGCEVLVIFCARKKYIPSKTA